MRFRIELPFVAPISAADMPAIPFDPFIFGVTGHEHGPFVGDNDPRGWEVHLADQPPTAKFDPVYFGMGHDASNPEEGIYFRNSFGMPSALFITTQWQHPMERIETVNAYPRFENWVSSGGEQNKDWFIPENAVQSNIFTH